MKTSISAALAALVLLSGCSLFKGGIKAPNAADLAAAKKAAEEAAAKLSRAQAAANEAIKNCPPADGNIPVPEEKGAGGAIMVAMAQDNGEFLFEGDLPELNAKPDKVKVDLKKPRNNVTAYVAKVGKNLASYSSRPELPWVFAVIENDGVNAFSAPGGYVVITTGLMRLVENEAQLAGVLGHEIGHIVNKDVLKTYSSVKHNICVPAVTVEAYIREGIADSLPQDVRDNGKFADDFNGKNAGKASGGLVEALTKGVLKLKKTFGAGKDAEYAADKVAFELMMFAGYDTAEFDKVLAKAEAGGKLFSNHPSNADRIKELVSMRTGPKKDDGSPDPDKADYSKFVTSGVAPKIPDDVKAALPAEGSAKPPKGDGEKPADPAAKPADKPADPPKA